ncbi:HNH endonuclease [Bacillus mycoides]
MQGETGKAIVNDINNNQKTVVTGLELANKFLIMEMEQTLQDFQSTTGESDENAVILEDALLQAQNKLSNLQPKKHELDSRISNIYNSVSDLISLSMPNSQFDEKLVAASKELEDTIQKVQQFESKKEKSDAENILNALNNQVQIAGKMGSLSYTDPQLQAFFALDDLAKGIHEMDTQITKAKKEAQLQAEREMKKKQEEWAAHHPVEAWLQNFSKSAGEKWDVLRKGTKWVGENIPFLKGLSDDVLVLEGFLGAAGSAISGIAIGAMKVTYLALELGEWGFNSIRGVETEQWKLDDIYGAGNTIKNLGQAIISWQDYPKYGKALVNSVKGYVEKALTDPYALGGAIFDIGSCFIGVGEVTAAVKGGKLAQGAKVFQVAEKSGKIGGKLEEIMAFTNKLPSSMKNVAEKIKNIEIPNLFRETVAAGVGSVEERKTLGELFSVAKSETKGTGASKVEDIPPAFKQEEFASTYEGRRNQTPLTEKNKKVGFEGLRGESLCTLKPPPDPGVKRILDGVGVKGIQYKNGVPDFSPVSKAQVEIDHMYGGTGSKNGNKARRSNFAQANEKLAEQLNKSPELASKFGMKPGNITKSDIEDFRIANNLTWHELNDVKTMQLVPSSINSTFGHLGGVGEINAGAYTPEGFATK